MGEHANSGLRFNQIFYGVITVDQLTTDQLLKLASLALCVAADNEGTELERKSMATVDRLLSEVVKRNEGQKSTDRVQGVGGVGIRIRFRT